MATKEISRKITISTIAGKAVKWFDRVMAAKGEPVKLCRLYGMAAGFTAGATEFGEFIKFQGSFRAVNLMTGEMQDAPQIILPDHLAAMLTSALKTADGNVTFAFEISAVFDVNVATKYRFVAESNLPPVENDPMAQIEAQMRAAGFELPAPAQAALSLPGAAPEEQTAEVPPADAPKGKARK